MLTKVKKSKRLFQFTLIEINIDLLPGHFIQYR